MARPGQQMEIEVKISNAEIFIEGNRRRPNVHLINMINLHREVLGNIADSTLNINNTFMNEARSKILILDIKLRRLQERCLLTAWPDCNERTDFVDSQNENHSLLSRESRLENEDQKKVATQQVLQPPPNSPRQQTTTPTESKTSCSGLVNPTNEKEEELPSELEQNLEPTLMPTDWNV